MRVLFTSSPAYGHLLPMLPLIRAAGAAGHEVRVATGPDLLTALAERGVRAESIGPTWAESWAAHDDVWADPGRSEEQRMTDGILVLFSLPARARLQDGLALTREWRPDLVVHELLELAGPLLARTLGVPGVVHGIGPMFPLYSALAGLAGAAIDEPGLWEQLSAEQALDICPPSVQPDGPALWPGAWALRPSAGEPGVVPPAVADVLAGDRPLAYFTLGTVKNADAADLRTGLAALAEYDGVVVATTGRRLDPGELGPLPENVVLEEFVPQARILERADLLVSHSGSGTMLGGLAHGVPQVAVPRGTDQPENAALMVAAGAGVVVDPDDYTVETVRTAVAQVTGDPSYRAAAERVRSEIAAMPAAPEIWTRLEELA